MPLFVGLKELEPVRKQYDRLSARQLTHAVDDVFDSPERAGGERRTSKIVQRLPGTCCLRQLIERRRLSVRRILQRCVRRRLDRCKSTHTTAAVRVPFDLFDSGIEQA